MNSAHTRIMFDKLDIKVYFNVMYTKDDFRNVLSQYNLNSNNCIVVGSGVLARHNLRKSSDIDVVVDVETFTQLEKSFNFDTGIFPDKAPYLKTDVLDVFIKWNAPGSSKSNYETLRSQSSVEDGVRYVDIQIVEQWKRRNKRTKDIHDLVLIEDHLKRNKNPK